MNIKHRTSIKHKFEKIPVVTRFKAMLEQPSGLVGFPRWLLSGLVRSFSVQIIEVCPGKNNKVCPVSCETRLDREDYGIETRRTSYPYGLNERKRKFDPSFPVRC